MRLLVVTQVVDIRDPILGFFHYWLGEFSKHFDKITVICLKKGECSLPSNVNIVSLGKEDKQSRFQYILRFYKYIFHYRKEYDSVFVHMNQEYILLGGLLWALLGKPAFLWRNHSKGFWITKLAGKLSKKVFYTSPQSFTAPFKNSIQMPVGVDTDFFKPSGVNREGVLIMGRISPVKKVSEMIAVASEVANKIPFTLKVIGGLDSRFLDYYEEVKRGLEKFPGKVVQGDGVPLDKVRDLFCSTDIFMNFTPEGSYDKMIFEAAACGTLVLSTNSGLAGQIPNECISTSKNETSTLENLLKLPLDIKSDLRNSLREQIVRHHGLTHLAVRLTEEL
ncbi:MAG: glycosyltransferase [Candidatus Vogelbacteria bacterium]|nr:glycosyltransferase [Candidatus Vogelbacteria bacterium]